MDPNITEILQNLGDDNAADLLVPVLYDELRRIAHNQLYRERGGHTLSTTALVHEAYLKLVDLEGLQWQNRSQFFAIASQAMRRILVDYARKRNAEKRGGQLERTALTDALAIAEERSDDLLALDDALTRLAKLDDRAVRIVEHRFFAGLSVEETADLLDISTSTVKREWRAAKAWLYREMNPASD